jgi:NAD/NADP transhydrogenase alpha subunit
MGRDIVNKNILSTAMTLPGQKAPINTITEPIIASMKKGGKVKKTGAYKLHEGETVVPKKLSTSDGYMCR